MKETHNELRRYLRSCRELHRDVEAALVDEEFRFRGNEIAHAVDFSEIYSYVLPGEAVKGAGAFAELTYPQQVAINEAILSRLFFGDMSVADNPPPIVLLPPYRVELLGSRTLLSKKAFVRFGKLLHVASAELNRLRTHPRLEAIVKTLDSCTATSEMLTKAQDQLFEILRNSGPQLLLLSREPEEWSPARRLRTILDKSRLVGLSEILLEEPDLDDLDAHLVDELEEMIREQRKDATNPPSRVATRLDAQAIAYVLNVNDRMPPNRRLVLITRSESMHRAFSTWPRRNPRWENYLRRPRAFAAIALGGPSRAGKSRLDVLRRRRDTLASVIRQAEKIVEAGPNQVTSSAAPAPTTGKLRTADWQKVLGRLRRLWGAAHNLMVAESDWRVADEATLRPGQLSQILQWLRDHHQLHELVSAEIDAIADDIDSNNLLISHLLPAASEAQSVYRLDDIRGARTPQRSKVPIPAALVWSSRTLKTVSLYFYSDEVRQARKRGKGGERALEKFLYEDDRTAEVTHRRAASKRSGFYERFLAVAFLRALAGDWKMAERNCDRALDWPEDEDPTPRHEAYYLRGICRSRDVDRKRSAEVYRSGLADLDHATQSWRAANRTDVGDDPRFVFERGVQLYLWWQWASSAPIEKERRPASKSEEKSAAFPLESLPKPFDSEKDVPNLNRSLAHWKQALQMLEQEGTDTIITAAAAKARLRLDVANAICYVHAEHDVSSEDVVRHFHSLVQAINACQLSDREMPLGVLDTKYWCWWKHRNLIGGEPDWPNIVALIRERLPTEKLLDLNRKEVERHLAEIEAGFEASNAS